MKKFKNLVLFLAAATIALGASAQANTTTAKSVPTALSADKVDASQKGPNGETVYMGAKGGHYYMDKSGKKVYLKSDATSTTTTKATSTTDTKVKAAGQKPTTTQVKTTATDQKTKAAGSTTEVKMAQTTTKSSDKVNSALKGPNGEVVYTGPKGGNYYMSKTGTKVYLKK